MMGRVQQWISGIWESPVRLASVLVLIVRAACIFMLPALLVDALWFGVVEQGIHSAVPGIVQAQTLAEYERHMSTDERQLVEDSYSDPNAYGVRTFVGNPSQLELFSPLSRLLSRAAAGHDGDSSWHGVGHVREEYEAMGLDLKALQSASILRSIRNIASNVTAIALTTAIYHWLLATDTPCGQRAYRVTRGEPRAADSYDRPAA